LYPPNLIKGLTSKLKGLTENKDAVNQAQAAINSKATQRSLAGETRQQAAASSCADLLDTTQEMVDTLKENPASQTVGDLADQVVNISKVAVQL
jgi:hypothetical protein